MNFRFFRSTRGVGLDVGTASVKALVLEGHGTGVTVVGRGLAAVAGDGDFTAVRQAAHTALAEAGATGESVIASIGGPDVVIRVLSLPPVPKDKILPALEIQHRELGLLTPREAVTDAHVLRKSTKDVTANEILSVSLPKVRLEERMRLLRQMAIDVRILDVEPLALLNAAIQLTSLEAGELLVLLTVAEQNSALCLFSEHGPVVARYLDVGADAFANQLQSTFPGSGSSIKDFLRKLPPSDITKAEVACRDLVDRMAEDIRLSLTFYRTEYDRESLPRYAIGGSVEVPYIGRWVADRLGLGAPLELMDPFKAVEAKLPQTGADPASGPMFLQAFGLALRGL